MYRSARHRLQYELYNRKIGKITLHKAGEIIRGSKDGGKQNGHVHVAP